MSKEEVRGERLGDSLMLSELLSIVSRQRMNTSRKRRRTPPAPSCTAHGQSAKAGRSLVKRNERLLVAGADDQIALPVVKAATLFHDGGSQLDGHLIGNRASSFASAVALPACLLAAQGAMQGTTSTIVGIDRLIVRTRALASGDSRVARDFVAAHD